jgi:HK97 family phage prohead protease
MSLHVEYRAATTGGVDFRERTIEVRAIPYNEEADVEFQGKVIREVIEPGAFRDVDPAKSHITVNREHNYERTVGKVVDLRDDAAGPVALAHISATPLGDETLRLAADGVLKSSVGMYVARSGMEFRDGLRRIFRAGLEHIALLPNAAYAGAAVLGVRNEPEAPPVAELATPNLEEVLALAGMSDLIRGQVTRSGAER